MLTTAGVRAARPKAAAQKISDGGGLYLHVATTGTKSFRMRFQLAGREQTLTFGLWPEVTLEDARARRELARAQIGRGEDPRAPAADARWTVERAARAWHAHHLAGWSPVHAADVLTSLERDVLPAIGAAPLDSITRPRVLELLRAVEARGSRETARRLRQRLEAIFDFAAGEGWTDVANPAETVRGNLQSVGGGDRHPALVDVDQLRALTLAVSALRAAPIVILASRFLALTAVRLGSLQAMRWGEVEELDGQAPLWCVPAAHMKLPVHKKAAGERYDHLVPLSKSAAAVLRAVRALHYQATGAAPAAEDLVFPSPRSAGRDRPLGDGAIGALYDRAGYAGRHVPHGWRASFSTIMNRRRRADRGEIDAALGHKPRNEEGEKAMDKVEAAYNRAVHLDVRRQLLEEWATIVTPPPSAE